MITQAQCSTAPITAPAKSFRLIPAGLFRANDGRPHNIDGWVLNREAALKIIQAAQDRVSDFVIDYEHQTLKAQGPAPAAGWFHQLEWREGDGLYVVDARWTDIAARMIKSREYRYISPVFHFGKSGNVVSIHSAAITNTPALDGLTELVAARSQLCDFDRDRKEFNDLVSKLAWPTHPASDGQTGLVAARSLDADLAKAKKEFNEIYPNWPR